MLFSFHDILKVGGVKLALDEHFDKNLQRLYCAACSLVLFPSVYTWDITTFVALTELEYYCKK